MHDDNWIRVFEIAGAPGTLDYTGAAQAYEARLALVAADPRVARMRSKVESVEGSVEHQGDDERRVTGYTIDVIYHQGNSVG
jgi:hypothetical protein